MEEWKFVTDSTRFKISSTGRFLDTKTGTVRKPSIDKYGYPRTTFIDDNGKIRYKTIHRLVAESWLDPPEPDEDQVNHIDGDKLNSNKENLEWSNAKRNIIHSYETGLNKNTTPLKIFDKETKEEKSYRSIKNAAKTIGIAANVFISLARNSKNNPILGRYVVTFIDERILNERANTYNFGSNIFVYDEVTEEIKEYSSVLLMTYWTGLRSTSGLYDSGYIKRLGYQISFKKERIVKVKCQDKEEIIKQRYEYINKPHIKRTDKYFLYNYLTKEELEFSSVQMLMEYLNEIPPKRIIRSTSYSSAIHKAKECGRNGLLKGYGVTTSSHKNGWFPYSEEILLGSKNGLGVPCAYYRITQDGKSSLALGLRGLCKHFKIHNTRSTCEKDVIDLIESFNIPNLSVKRLNKPLS